MRIIYFILLLAAVHGCSTESDSPHIESKHAPYDHQLYRLSPISADFDAISAIQHLKKSVEVHGRTNRAASGSWIVEGPSNIGARINTVAINPLDPNHILAGFSSGGLYLTLDGGTTWTPTFDDNEYLAISDIVFSPHNSQELIIGTGDPNISGYPFLGNGAYRSTDGGLTWQSVGLQDVGIISKVGFHPTNPAVLWVSSMGFPYRRGAERGLYKSDDSGESWQKTLQLGDQTGVIDFLIDPQDGEKIYAAGWDRIRRYDESTISGLGAKIYKSQDGGMNWTTLTRGLPSGPQGRIGLAMAPSNTDRLYALFVNPESNLEGIYTSVNEGGQWEEIPTDPSSGLSASALGGFGWYFGKIRIHPQNELKPYLLGVSLWEFIADRQQWEQTTSGSGVHADMHDLTFIGTDTMVLATDGGLYRSPNRGRNWADIESIATTQFYRVDYNPHGVDPSWGGAQDNGIVAGNANAIDQWRRVRSADGFRSIFHPTDPLTIYTESQLGGLVVSTDGGASFRNATNGISSDDRRNWDLPVIMSSHDPNTLYYGTQKLYRSQSGTDVQFIAISPDLTDRNFSYGPTSTITAIAESASDPSSLLVGTGDGNLWKSEDLGSWEILDGLPKRWYTSLQYGEQTQEIYTTQTGYKDGHFVPYIHHSSDGGEVWKNIGIGLPQTSVNDLLILPNNSQQVLFAATDAGVYYTEDAGASWARLGNNLPIIATYELEYNPVQNTLLAATYGKSIQSFDLDQIGLSANPSVSATDWVIDFSIYPNPAERLIRISDFSGNLSQYRWTVIDQGGRVNAVSITGQEIDVDQFVPGMYYLIAENGANVQRSKFIKK